MTYPIHRGNSLFGFLIAFAIGGLLGAGIACLAGWICGSSGGGGGGTVAINANQCTSSPNSCGLVSIGTYTYTCPTAPAGHSYTFVDPNGVDTNAGTASGISASTPTCYEVRPGSGDEPAQVYVPDNNNGGFATVAPNKSCNATPPSDSQCPSQSCTSPANACGQTSTGTKRSDGSCSATTPSNTNCACTSGPNACGQTNTGFLNAGGSCAATVPSNAGCPPPVIPDNGFTANPSILTTTVANPSGQTTLTWNSTNSTDCSIAGDNGFSASGGPNGSTVASLNTTTTFTLTCQDGPGGPTASKSVRVIVNAKYREQ